MTTGQPAGVTLRLWGVRGSIPTPGPDTVRYGGNTPCVSIEIGDELCLVLDAGTGIRKLGKYLLDKPCQVYVLISHEHWDHIQGFPFFAPIYQKGRRLVLFPVQRGNMLTSLVHQMDGAHFPVTPEQLPSEHELASDTPMEVLAREGLEVTRQRVNHPGYCFGYRVTAGERSIVYIPDNEIDPPDKPHVTRQQLIEFCRGADVLLHDSQLLPEDLPAKRGWGHSVVSQVCELAADAEVKHLVLFHHDPDRSDDQLDAISRQCQDWCKAHAPKMKLTGGYEGLALTF